MSKVIAVSPQQTRVFRITDIPAVMQFRLGWSVSAALMRRWFQGSAYEMSISVKRNREDPLALTPNQVEDKLVTMAWALRFQRVMAAYSQLVSGWDSPAGRAELKRLIVRSKPARLPPNVTYWRFGDLSKPGQVLDKSCQVNFVTVGQLSDRLDDFYGAIGKGVLKIAVSGIVTPQENGRLRIAIDEVGVYLRDTYDFNDDESSLISQPLGYWGFQGVDRGVQLRWDIEIDESYVDAGSVPNDRLYAVQNDDFCRYRRKYGRGGDFVIYSDVKRQRLARPKILEL